MAKYRMKTESTGEQYPIYEVEARNKREAENKLLAGEGVYVGSSDDDSDLDVLKEVR